MSDNTQSNQNKDTQNNNSAQKLDYAKWLGLFATFLSIFLAFLSYRLDAQKREAERKLQDFSNQKEQINVSVEQDNAKIKRDLDFNYYFEGATTAPQKFRDSNSSNTVFPNEVYNQIVNQMTNSKWGDFNNLMRCVYGSFDNNPNRGMINSRQILYFEISYNSSDESKKASAEKLTITYRFKDFPAMPREGSLRRQTSFQELDVNNWPTKTEEIGELKAGRKVIIPGAHTIGPYVFSERIIIPTKLDWYNPILKKKEEKSLPTQTMLTELGAKSKGSLLGNIGRSCQ